MSQSKKIQNSFVIERVAQEHLASMCILLNEESKRSAATVAHQDEALEAWRQNWQSTQNQYPWLVALESDSPSFNPRVLGYAKASAYNQREGFKWTVVLSIYLHPDSQGKSIGTYLYQSLIQILIQQGYCVAYARITLPNSASLALHQRFGFKQIGLLPHFAWKFDQWHDQALLVSSFHTSLPNPPPSLLSVDEVLSQNPSILNTSTIDRINT